MSTHLLASVVLVLVVSAAPVGAEAPAGLHDTIVTLEKITRVVSYGHRG